MTSALRPSRYDTGGTATSANKSNSNGSDKSALAYLLRYESMVRSQDVEDMATSDHLRPLFDRLILLGTSKCKSSASAFGGGDFNKFGGEDVLPDLMVSHSGTSEDEADQPPVSSTDDTVPQKVSKNAVLTYAAMKIALHKLDDATKKSSRERNTESVILSTDRQLMLLLRTIVDAAEHGSAASGEEDSNGLTYAEFLQVYKVVVGGMQTLQRVPKKGDNASSGNIASQNNIKDSVSDVRLRVRERTLTLIKLFAPKPSYNQACTELVSSGSATSLLRDDSTVGSGSSSVSSLPSLPGKLVSRRGKSKSKKDKGITTRSGGSKYRDPTGLPRDSAMSTLSTMSVASTVTDAEDVRRVLTIKDKTMLNLLSDHAGEMDDLTERMIEISRKSRRRRSKMIAWGVGVGLVGLLIGVLFGSSGFANTDQMPGAADAAASASSSTSTSSSSSPSSAEAILASELKYTKRQLGQVNAKVTKLQRRASDAESDGARAASMLHDCKSNLLTSDREVDDLKVEIALARDEIDVCSVAKDKANAKAAAVLATTKSGHSTSNQACTKNNNALVPVMKQASSAMAGAAGAVLVPQIASAIAAGSVRVLAAAGAGLWAGVGLLLGAVVSGALPGLLEKRK